MKHSFPWCAVVGQEQLKLALLLCAIDPGIGGVLVRGPRGVAKTTLARAFAELLPGRFVELPLGATEERVTGTLDLGKVLQDGQVQFSPGLLGRAHEGVLYVDEVNLLSDALVDVLLDAAATGHNVVERDGVSHTHPARFVLVGTMNPEEGELRPQFIDRFGLAVSAESEIAPRERAQIVMRRLEFESNPQRFLAGFEAEQRALIDRCLRARERAAALAFMGPGLTRVAELCHAAGVEGVRADLAMLRAARAHAAWHEHGEILVEDVEAVAELALTHRRRSTAAPSGSSSPGERGRGPGGMAPSGNAPGGHAPSGTASSGNAPSGNAPSGAAPAQSQVSATPRSSSDAENRGALPPVPVRAIALPELPAWLVGAGKPARAQPGSSGVARRRRQGGYVLGLGDIDWFGTLVRCPRPTRNDFRRRRRALRRESLWLIAIDCSASMLESGALAVAKGVAQALAESARLARARLALISFSGEGVFVQSSAEVGPSRLERTISALGASGGTPLRQALLEALALCNKPVFRAAQVEKRLVLLSDGRTNESVADLGPRCLGLELIVLDCECGPLRLQRARRLAAALHGEYRHVESLVQRGASGRALASPLAESRRGQHTPPGAVP